MFKQSLSIALIVAMLSSASAHADSSTTSRQSNRGDDSPVCLRSAGHAVMCGIAAAFLVAAVASAAKQSGSGSQYVPSRDDDDSQYMSRDNRVPEPAPSGRPDGSLGCAWGDRTYGTCH